MKTFYLAVVCIAFSHHLFAKIRNGYEPQLESSRVSLQNLNLFLLDKKLSATERALVKTKIETLVDYISFYELTDQFIRQFKIVSPIIFTDLDNIQDKKGRPTDVYIKLISEKDSRIPRVAATFINQMSEDEDANVSTYGPYSVSVDIFIVHDALLLLSHELGHIKYIIPNLATYTKYYNWRYKPSLHTISAIGHGAHDLSGKYAHIYERQFLAEKKTYYKNGGKKPMSLTPLLVQIKRNTRNQQTDYPLLFASNNIH